MDEEAVPAHTTILFITEKTLTVIKIFFLPFLWEIRKEEKQQMR